MTARPRIVQINLASTLGGAEVFTAFMSRALIARDWPTTSIVGEDGSFWSDLEFGGVEPVRVREAAASVNSLAAGDIVLIHGSLPASVLTELRRRGPVLGIAHQTLYDSSRPAYYDHADLLFGVSRHVIDSLTNNGLPRVYATPLYGIGEIDRRHHETAPRRGPLCEWDEHKLRDRVLALAERAKGDSVAAIPYLRRPGLTLGIVSRLAPLKQFPAMFEILAPIIAAQPAVNLEIFGVAVGYKALREMRRAVRPLGSRVRFWGHQRDVTPAYRNIDYLLTGMPDREALGLNVIESCLCGTPALAINAPPFTETMCDGVTGFLYTDPRKDQGRHFAQLLASLADGTHKPDMTRAPAHLERFSFDAFADRVDIAMREAVALTASRNGPH